MLQKILLDSFIRGVGKTSGAIVVFGAIGGVWYLGTRWYYNKFTKQMNEQTELEFHDTYSELPNQDHQEEPHEQSLDQSYFETSQETPMEKRWYYFG